MNILGATVQELGDSVMCIFILQLIGTAIDAGVGTLPQGRSCGKSGNLHCGQFVYQCGSEYSLHYSAGDHYAYHPRAIVGTTIGSTAALVPLVIYINPTIWPGSLKIAFWRYPQEFWRQRRPWGLPIGRSSGTF